LTTSKPLAFDNTKTKQIQSFALSAATERLDSQKLKALAAAVVFAILSW
jgi:hypothetical protein